MSWKKTHQYEGRAFVRSISLGRDLVGMSHRNMQEEPGANKALNKYES